jgi:hypothetical protein
MLQGWKNMHPEQHYIQDHVASGVAQTFESLIVARIYVGADNPGSSSASMSLLADGFSRELVKTETFKGR